MEQCSKVTGVDPHLIGVSLYLIFKGILIQSYNIVLATPFESYTI